MLIFLAIAYCLLTFTPLYALCKAASEGDDHVSPGEESLIELTNRVYDRHVARDK